jgi:hypothetical protein
MSIDEFGKAKFEVKKKKKPEEIEVQGFMKQGIYIREGARCFQIQTSVSTSDWHLII